MSAETRTYCQWPARRCCHDLLACGAAQPGRPGEIDGQRRWFLARQTVLRAIRLVLVAPPCPPEADPDLAAELDGLGPETAAALLTHLAADALTQARSANEPRLCGMAESLAMEVIANNLFNDRDDVGDLLARYRMLWMDYGNRLMKFPARWPPADLLAEATGIGLDDVVSLAFAFWAHIRACEHAGEIKLNATISPRIRISQATVSQFLRQFSRTPSELAALTAIMRPGGPAASRRWRTRWRRTGTSRRSQARAAGCGRSGRR